MEFPNFVGPSYKLNTVSAAGDVCRNLYLETIERGPRAGKQRLVNIPGLPLFKEIAAPIRGMWSNATTLFVIGGGQMWQVFSDNTPNTLIGNLGSDTNPAMIASNGFQLAIASANAAYIAPGGGAGIFPLTDTTGAPINARSIAFQDQYFIAAINQSKQINISNLAPAGGIWDPSDVAIKEAYSDNISRVWVDYPGGELLWLFGDESTEVWTDTGGLFPFQRIQSMVFPIGCDSTWSVAGVVGNRFWMWRGQIWWASGYQPQRVSDYGVEQAIKGYSLNDRQNAEGYSWVDGGHIFYAISFPTAGRTWVFDLKEQAWHERLYFSNGQYGRYRPRMVINAFGMNLGGDYSSGKIFQLDPNTYTDADGAPLRWERICPYVTDETLNVKYKELRIDMDTGIGLNAGVPGSNPQVMMRYSRDRGKTWSNERQSPLGPIGETLQRAVFRQLGSSYIGMNFDVYGTDPVPTSIVGAYIDVNPGNRARMAAGR